MLLYTLLCISIVGGWEMGFTILLCMSAGGGWGMWLYTLLCITIKAATRMDREKFTKMQYPLELNHYVHRVNNAICPEYKNTIKLYIQLKQIYDYV